MHRIRRLARLGLLLAIRYTPLPWRAKRRLIWLGGPKVLFASCALIRDEHERVLLLRSRYSNEWQFPGGCANRGESALHALERECREELGLELRNPRLLGVYADMGGLSQCALYASELGPGAIRLSEEHTEWRFAAIEELPASVRQVMRSAAAPTDG